MKTDLQKAVKLLRDNIQYYIENRHVIVLSEESKKGQQIISAASHYDGYDLRQVYGKPSDIKKRIYNEVFEQYRNDNDSDAFSITSHNGFMFTVSWINRYGVRYLTRDNDYIVVTSDMVENIFTDFN